MTGKEANLKQFSTLGHTGVGQTEVHWGMLQLQGMTTKLCIHLSEALLTKFEGKGRRCIDFSLVKGRTVGIFTLPNSLQKFSLPSSSTKLTSLLLLLCEEYKS